MKNEVLTVPKEFTDVIVASKITDLNKAEKLMSNYAPLLNEVTAITDRLKPLTKGKPGDEAIAKRVYIDLGKVASRATDRKAIDKADLLVESRLIDSLFQVVNGVARMGQADAKEIELYAQKLEEKRLEDLQVTRAELLLEYVEDAHDMNLSVMDEEVWGIYFEKKKQDYLDKIAAEKKAESDRIAKELADAADKLRLEKEVAELKAAADKKAKEEKEIALKQASRVTDMQPYITFIRDYNKLLSAEDTVYVTQLAAIKKMAEQQWAADKKIADKKVKDELAAAESLRVAKAAADLVLQEAKDFAKAKADRELEELAKGDDEKMQGLVKDLTDLKTKYVLDAPANKEIYSYVGVLLDKVVTYINERL